MFFRSIRWRLQLWHGLILFVVLAGFGFTAYRLQYATELRRVDQELDQRVSVLIGSMRRPGPPGGPGSSERRPPGEGGRPTPPAEEMRPGPSRRGPEGDFPPPRGGFRLPDEHAALFSAAEGSTFYFILWRRDGAEIASSTNAPPGLSRPGGEGRSLSIRGVRSRGELRESFYVTPPGECILVGRPITPELTGLRQLSLALTGLGAVVLVLGLGGGWWLASRAIRPIDDIGAAAARIAAGDLSHRIGSEDTDNELGRLAGVLNSTFSRLEAAFTQQARFTADASHELRTPLSVILSQTQMALTRERDAADYRETLETCQRAAQRMRRLMESLLELARLDAGQETMNTMPLDLSRVTAEVVELLRPLADEKKITLQCDLAPSECAGDADRIAQVITNLVGNSIHHNREGGEVRLTTRREEGSVTLTVADNGPGIAAEHLSHIFERFYRADSARTSAQGHAGLGLAISKAIVEAHAGMIEARNEPGGGATFIVRLPFSPDASQRPAG